MRKMKPEDWVDVRASGKTVTGDGEFDCGHPGNGDIVGISFANDGNQDVEIDFGGAKRVLVNGTEFTHFTNYPYRNRTKYAIKFIATAVAAAVRRELNIYTLKAI